MYFIMMQLINFFVLFISVYFLYAKREHIHRDTLISKKNYKWINIKILIYRK